jgi:hypothetical protein
MSTRLAGRLVRATAIEPSRREEMFRLFEKYYENVSQAKFIADLAEKHWVIMLLDPQNDELCGFSTQMFLELTVEGESVKGLFSGDTVVARDHWGHITLARMWGRLALSLIDKYAPETLYWFLISKGYKTYRFLPLFFHEYYPRYDAATPPGACRLIDRFARYRFPLGYDPSTGVIRAGRHKDHLRSGVADVTAERLRDPHVRFFEQCNPGHIRGEELCCLAPLSRDNFTPAAYRVIAEESIETEG